MKLAVTKALAKEINPLVKDYFEINAINNMSYDTYERIVSTDFDDIDNDFNWTNNTFRVWRIEYPDNYFACNQYITTKDLSKLAKRIEKPLTLEKLAAALIENYEI